jgi:hypothetical protein
MPVGRPSGLQQQMILGPSLRQQTEVAGVVRVSRSRRWRLVMALPKARDWIARETPSELVLGALEFGVSQTCVLARTTGA